MKGCTLQSIHSVHTAFTKPSHTVHRRLIQNNIPITLLSPLTIIESAPFKVPQQFICRLYFLHPQSFTRGGDVKDSEHQTFTPKTYENQPIRYLLWTSERFFRKINCVFTRALQADNGRESVQWNRGNGTVEGSGLKGITYRIYNSPKHSLKHTHFSLKHIHNPTKCHTFATPAPSLSTMPKSGVVLWLYGSSNRRQPDDTVRLLHTQT